jgi:hypothetical protein
MTMTMTMQQPPLASLPLDFIGIQSVLGPWRTIATNRGDESRGVDAISRGGGRPGRPGCPGAAKRWQLGKQKGSSVCVFAAGWDIRGWSGGSVSRRQQHHLWIPMHVTGNSAADSSTRRETRPISQQLMSPDE